MTTKWCKCETVTRVLRDGNATCGQCGGRDAYKKAKERPENIIKEIEKLKLAEKLLWQVALTMNYCLNVSNDLPDSFDDQLCEGIESYFKAT